MSPGIQDAFNMHKTPANEESEKPVFVIDVAIVRDNVKKFIGSWESTGKVSIVHFSAVKACADTPVMDVYDDLECNFDCASKGSLSQIEKILQASHKVSELGDRDVTTVLAELKPFCRLVSSSKGSDKPFSNHFGVEAELALEIIEKAKSGGLTFVGLSGHPGTQNLAKDAFVHFAKLFRGVFDRVKEELSIKMEIANIGGGWAGISTKDAPSFTDYNKTTMDAFSSVFVGWESTLTVMTEPGRCLISNAGWLQTHVINISSPSSSTDLRRVCLSAGTHHGLKEASKISFEWHTCHPRGTTAPCVLYEPTCDSDDIILGRDANGNERTIDLPLELKVGELVWIYGPKRTTPRLRI
ncbi:ornithine decarboxylase [Fusarium mundagurra]|uniref:Ornithine decarboxylase n=1 Tax=Fusarium mundagurra TaxID=1567541 RepID=A0A8H6DQ42_9HYPO|nr:ornithine decarboxylase [Fusarium mundagurra]